MRKIKFRGKTLDGRWIYGDLWHRPYAKDCVTIVSFMEDTGTTGGLEVIPETVGQYTGLKDKNGVEVYEGDILKVKMHFNEYENYEIVWDSHSASFDALNVNKSNFIIPEYWRNCEVIGNIHDNPELLEVEE